MDNISPAIQKTIISLIIILGLGFFLYYSYSSSPTLVSVSASIAGEDILNLADKLNSISIDKSIFTSNSFLSLKDFAAALYPENQGRPNPFASIGTDSGSTNSTKTQTSSGGKVIPSTGEL